MSRRPAFLALAALCAGLSWGSLSPPLGAQEDPGPPAEAEGAETLGEGKAAAGEDADDPYAGSAPDFDSVPGGGGFDELLPVESSGTVRTIVGAGRLATYPFQIQRLAMADDTIARVQIITGQEILYTPLRPGRTTLYLWLADGRRLSYVFQADPDVELAELVLRDIDPDIEMEVRGDVLILRGEVSDEVAEQAVRRVDELVPGVRIIDFMSPLRAEESADARLEAALKEIDERIEVRRIQVGAEPDPAADTYVLEGRVKSVAALVQAMTVAERQLGDTEIGVVPVEGGQELALRGFAESSASASGLAAQISRGLDLMSPSGRVISFLEVDELPQILVRVKVMEVDRSKARNLGIDLSFAGERLAVPPLIGGPGLAVDYVDDTFAITAFIDFLESKALARSVIEPAVLTLSGEQASIVVGGQVPIPTTSLGNVSTVQGFRFQEFGVSLSIRPTLIEGDVIALDVAPSVSRPSPAFEINDVPGFTFQSVQTTARVHAGQSLVVGGLLSFNETLDQTNLPWLRRLPIFNSKRRSRAETELLFVITPRFVSIDPAEPVPPVPTVGPDQLALPELDWPHDRDKWNDPFEPQEIWPDGVPPSLRRLPPVPIRRLEDDLALDAELAPDVRYVSEAAEPCLNLRPEPTRWFEPRDCLPPGTRVEVLGEESGWSRVIVPSGEGGWVATRFLTPPRSD